MAKDFSQLSLVELCGWHIDNDFKDVGSIRNVVPMALHQIKENLGIVRGWDNDPIATRLKADNAHLVNYIRWAIARVPTSDVHIWQIELNILLERKDP
jgi:hypothetical protein